MSSQLVILSGPPNAGKSATAEALCQRYDRMLHLDVGLLRDSIRMGRLRPWDDTPAGRAQRELLTRSASDTARRFLAAGYGVVVDDVVLAREVSTYQDALAGCGSPVHFIVLLPELRVLLEREAKRPTEWHRGNRLVALHSLFSDWKGVAAIDPEALAPEGVADRVMELAAEGRALLSAP